MEDYSRNKLCSHDHQRIFINIERRSTHSFTVSTIGEDVMNDLSKKADMTLSLFEMTRKGFLNCEELAAPAILVRPRATALPHCRDRKVLLGKGRAMLRMSVKIVP